MNYCKHLNVIINYELSKGNVVLSLDTNWSNVDVAISLKKPLDKSMFKEWDQIPELSFWENRDTHYPLQNGYYCKECKISVAGPMEK